MSHLRACIQTVLYLGRFAGNYYAASLPLWWVKWLLGQAVTDSSVHGCITFLPVCYFLDISRVDGFTLNLLCLALGKSQTKQEHR